jgi:hypothetical protein
MAPGLTVQSVCGGTVSSPVSGWSTGGVIVTAARKREVVASLARIAPYHPLDPELGEGKDREGEDEEQEGEEHRLAPCGEAQETRPSHDHDSASKKPPPPFSRRAGKTLRFPNIPGGCRSTYRDIPTRHARSRAVLAAYSSSMSQIAWAACVSAPQ